MSTRCQIAFDGNKVFVYRHSDGYPTGVLPSLMDFVNRFMAARGYDAEYLVARLVQHFTNEYDRDMAAMYERMGEKRTKMEVLGFGVDTELHGDINYLYTVRKDGSIEVRSGFGADIANDAPSFVVKPKTSAGDLKALLTQHKAE